MELFFRLGDVYNLSTITETSYDQTVWHNSHFKRESGPHDEWFTRMHRVSQ